MSIVISVVMILFGLFGIAYLEAKQDEGFYEDQKTITEHWRVRPELYKGKIYYIAEYSTNGISWTAAQDIDLNSLSYYHRLYKTMDKAQAFCDRQITKAKLLQVACENLKESQ